MSDLDEQEVFLHSCKLNGKGGAQPLDLIETFEQPGTDNVSWINLDVNKDEARDWLNNDSNIETSIVDALLAEETRPYSHSTDKGLLLVLRGVNTNPGNDPADMVSVRIWIESHRIITTNRRRLLSLKDVELALNQGTGPKTSGEFLTFLIERLADRIGDFVDGIEDELLDCENGLSTDSPETTRKTLGLLRRQIAGVRRFLAPQRDAMDRLYRLPCAWLSETDIRYMREETDRITRYLEDLDLARERAVVLQEEFQSQLAQQQNTRMYVLSMVAAIFLPLTFITGLLGMNVGGLPGLENPSGFWASIGIMILAAILLVVFFRHKRWL